VALGRKMQEWYESVHIKCYFMRPSSICQIMESRSIGLKSSPSKPSGGRYGCAQDRRRVQRDPAVGLLQQLRLLARDAMMSADRLVQWLDENIPHGQIDQEDMQIYVLDVIERLRNERNFTLEQLSAERHRLRDAVVKKIDER